MRETALTNAVTLRIMPQLSARDVEEITALYTGAIALDGGQPFAADRDWLRGWYLGATGVGTFDKGGRLVGICARRSATVAGVPRTEVFGQVDPAHRRLGIGTRLLAEILDGHTATAPILLRTESLTDSAHALYERHGLRQTFAEDVMSLSLASDDVPATVPTDIVLTEWTRDNAPRFFAVYDEAFRARPGFPGWSMTQWVEWHTDDDDFRPDWSLLATTGGTDVGFVVGAGGTSGWIVQIGTVPAARSQGIASLLITEAVRRMRVEGMHSVHLNVNINNPRARGVYERLGFSTTGRRARYEA